MDIQQDVRMLENRVKDIAADIKRIGSDIEDMRDAGQDAEIDYDKIELLAKRFTFGEHPLTRLEDRRTCQLYLEMLLNIVRLDADTEAAVHRLVFIQWLLIQADIKCSLEDLYKDCFRMGKDTYAEFVDSIPSEYTDSFIVDGLITAGISGSPNREVMAYMADLSAALGAGKEELRVLSMVSQMVLSQSVRADSKEDLHKAYSCLGKFSYYMGTEDMKRGIAGFRRIALELPADGSIRDFQWKVKNKQMVKEGDVIATFVTGSGANNSSNWIAAMQSYRTEEIQAQYSGKLFQFRDRGTIYGIISHEADNLDSIEAWIRKMDNKLQGDQE